MTEHKEFVNETLDRCHKIKAAIDAMDAGAEKERLTVILKVALNLFTFIIAA